MESKNESGLCRKRCPEMIQRCPPKEGSAGSEEPPLLLGSPRGRSVAPASTSSFRVFQWGHEPLCRVRGGGGWEGSPRDVAVTCACQERGGEEAAAAAAIRGGRPKSLAGASAGSLPYSRRSALAFWLRQGGRAEEVAARHALCARSERPLARRAVPARRQRQELAGDPDPVAPRTRPPARPPPAGSKARVALPFPRAGPRVGVTGSLALEGGIPPRTLSWGGFAGALRCSPRAPSALPRAPSRPAQPPRLTVHTEGKTGVVGSASRLQEPPAPAAVSRPASGPVPCQERSRVEPVASARDFFPAGCCGLSSASGSFSWRSSFPGRASGLLQDLGEAWLCLRRGAGGMLPRRGWGCGWRWWAPATLLPAPRSLPQLRA